ncbi:poly-beta-1,6-N-acetyl-D-glucosamine N-deacetylase PgaB [Bordetella sp. BOR01]|uniref:poly-beta-1,6-N-acetyl-D-glucosamine N-deacetylase PgaB n=1 Tax=Bordetella sp. BOR01 TaxID=2854779 RepID=UPI001C46EFA1|nr:poly-beta-1,6-N-acetyl-D-glucosamine N-deacetylase PgaB [Bordetella sp. BOR01]MBV7486405.1 poly-beta-1,6-N-acetyl-D-glucosamine N-deacetylase PgaB [Bordetella sp. BOR01]
MLLSFPRLFALCLVACLLGACAQDQPVFVAPADRPQARAAQPWPANQFVVLGYHEVEDSDPDQRFLSVRTDHLVQQLTWLRENGYQAVSIEQILAAHRGEARLPGKAVLLTFDDGYRSSLTRVLPILRAFNWPAVVAPVGKWMDTPAGQPVDFGGEMVERERFLDWQDVRELSRSGLVEIGAHTDNLHSGAPANPQGNSQPRASIRIYDPASGTYEGESAYQARITRDVDAISNKIRQTTGKPPRVWIWPYGAEGGTALGIAGEHGYQMAMTLADGPAHVQALMSTPRLLISNDPIASSFASSVVGTEARPFMRVAHVDIDYVYDPDPEQTDRNLGELVQRILDMQINTVFLQAFADPQGDGLARELYFPNRWLPMRADLFNRVAWQLRNRAHVQIYAWLPVLSFDLDPSIARVMRWNPESGAVEQDPEQYQRLSPFDPVARQRIIEIYQDLSRHAIFDGVLFHDDAVLTDFEDASPAALAAYRLAGLPAGIGEIRADPDAMARWTRYKSKFLVDWTLTLAGQVKAIRGPSIKTARNIFAGPIMAPESEAWFAQNLDDFLSAYDWTAPMAMPFMEDVPPGQEHAWLDQMVDTVARRPGALDRTVFELQAREWRDIPGQGEGQAIDTVVLADWMKRLQLRGARNFGYYPDDFLQDHPALEQIRPAISDSWYPVR